MESTLSAKPLEIPVSADVRSELRVRPSPLLFSRNNVDTTEGPKYTEELVTIVGPKGMKLTPDQSALFSLVEQSMPNQSDTEHSAEEVRFQIRVIGDTKSVKDGTITFSVEGVSNETRYAIPYLVVE